MSDHAPHAAEPVAPGAGHDDPMSHVPPGSIWPLLVSLALVLVPLGALAALGALHFEGDVIGLFSLTFLRGVSLPSAVGLGLLVIGGIALVFTLMGWAHQIIKEKPLAHDPAQQQGDLKMFTACFLLGELAIFGAIFAYFYHRKIWALEGEFAVPQGLHFGGPIVAYATFMLLSSSVTCELAHHFLAHGRRGLAKLSLLATLILGIVFLGFQAYEYGMLITRGFTPGWLGENNPGIASFASIFYTATGFHGLHVAIGLVMLFMVLLRLEFGHFSQKRHFSMVAASWYWHFVDVVWVLLFITVYVVGHG